MKRQKSFLILAVALFLYLLIYIPAFGNNLQKGNQPKKDAKPQYVMTQSRFAAPGGKSENYSITWEVISSGGTDGSSTSYNLQATTGQTAVGTGSSDSYGLSHGFWQEIVSPSECECLPADANNDDAHNVADAVYIINYVFKSGPPPTPYEICSGDAQCDCSCNVADAVYLINYVFKNGPPPCSCEDWVTACGTP